MSRVFLSYRREDSSDVTGRIYDRLVGHFGTDNVFKDVDSIPLGVDFRTHISGAVELCDVVLTIIGPRWLSAKDSAGARRLDDPHDFVRLEVGAALERDIPVIPVIVGGATMPTPEELPEAIREIAFRNGTRVRPDPDFHRDMDRLIAAVGEGKPPAEHGSTVPARTEARVSVDRDAEVASPAHPLVTGMPDHGELAGAQRDYIAEEVSVAPVREVGCAGSESPETIERTASIALLRPGRQADLDALVAALSDPYPQIRGAAISALATAPPESSQIAWEALIAGLTFERHVPAGPFSSGVNDDPDDELGYLPGVGKIRAATAPARTLQVAEFFIDCHPVTNEAYALFLAQNPDQTPPAGWSGISFPAGMGDHPVAGVSLFSARAYARWAGRSLPTGNQWEKAARGADGRLFPWGNRPERECCNTVELGLKRTTEVGRFSPHGDSPYGVSDMAGNVWEWTESDDSSTLLGPPTANQMSSPGEAERRGDGELRGGSFHYGLERARGHVRFARPPHLADSDFGFRCILQVAGLTGGRG